MKLKMMASQIILISSLLCSTFSNSNISSFTNLEVNYELNWKDIYDIDEGHLVAEIPSSKIKLYYAKEDKDFGTYRGFILQIDDEKKYYGWESVTTPSFAPKLELADLNNDGIEEIVVYICKGHGTGIYDEEVHVIKQLANYNEVFDETLIENPVIILYKNAEAKEFPEYFEVIVGNKKFRVNKKGILTPPYEKVSVGFGEGNTDYEVKNNTLYARVRVGADMINIGELIVKYKYQNKILQMESIDFVSFGRA